MKIIVLRNAGVSGADSVHAVAQRSFALNKGHRLGRQVKRARQNMTCG